MAVGGSSSSSSTAAREPLGVDFWLDPGATVGRTETLDTRAGGSDASDHGRGHALFPARLGAASIAGCSFPDLAAVLILAEGRPWPAVPGVKRVGRVATGEAGSQLCRIPKTWACREQPTEDVCL